MPASNNNKWWTVTQVWNSSTPSFTTVNSPLYPKRSFKTISYVKPPRSYQLRDIWCYSCGREDIWWETAGTQETEEGASLHVEQGYSLLSVNAHIIGSLPVILQLTDITMTACISGKLNCHTTQILLDSGASCSVMQANYTLQTNLINPCSITLVNANGRKLTFLRTTTAMLNLGIIAVKHALIVMENHQHLSSLLWLPDHTSMVLSSILIQAPSHSQFNTGRQVAFMPNTLLYVTSRQWGPPSIAIKSYFITAWNFANKIYPALSQAQQDHAMLFKSD